MPQFMIISRAPGILPEQWAETAVDVYAAEHATFKQAYVNLGTGFIFTIYEADTREKLVEQLEELGLPFDEIHEIQLAQSFDEMEQMLRKAGKI